MRVVDRRVLATCVTVALAVIAASASAAAGAGSRPRRVLENETVIVQRVRIDPNGTAAFPFRALPTLLVNVRDRTATFVPAGEDKRVANDKATGAEVIAIGVKLSRRPAAAAPPTAAPTGITRENLIDNDQVRVVRVLFATDGREPVHTHPNDLLTVQLTPGRVEIGMGAKKRTVACEPGFVQFLPRDVAHAYASADTKPFELLSVAIK
jgi:quercetin dioxygenase-like cupin family protein